MSLGERISFLRKSKGISQELLAENSNISLRTVQRIESGASLPRPFTVKALADALNIPVEELTIDAEAPGSEDLQDFETLKLINLSALIVFILPFGNIILPWLIWRKNKAHIQVNSVGRRVISFQILWTIATFFTIILTQSLMTGSSTIGHLPPTIFIVYAVFLLVNLIFTISTAVKLNKKVTAIYSFTPGLF